MLELFALLVIVVIIGALLGADSFGETIRTGCGCLGLILALGVLGLFMLMFMSGQAQ